MQQQLIDYLVEDLSKKAQVVALYLKGSLAGGYHDAYSDVDFYCVVKEGHEKEMIAYREPLLAGFHETIYASEVNFGDPQKINIYKGDLHLDFYVTSQIPTSGVSAIFTLYDPNHVLSSYKKLPREDDPSILVTHFNESIYTFHEYYIAIKREDWLWASRLESHILASLGIILDATCKLDRPVLHLKGVHARLSKDMKELICRLLSTDLINNTQLRYDLLIELFDRVLINHKYLYSNIKLSYYEYVKKHHKF